MTAMMTLKAVKEQLRAGPYAWPGGYPRYFICGDGEAMCFACVRKQWRGVVSAHRQMSQTNGHRVPSNVSEWLMAATGVNWEDPDLFCAHCGTRIQSAYAEEEAEPPSS